LADAYWLGGVGNPGEIGIDEIDPDGIANASNGIKSHLTG
jgi:hypothetical protein